MIDSLNSYDWAAIFRMCCGEESGSYLGSGPDTPPISPALGTSTPVTHFSREDVKRVIAQSDGENDERDWLLLAELKDGRFAFIAAGCDYTGWDCMGNSGVCVVAPDLATMVRLGLTDAARDRLGDQIEKELT